MRAGGSISQILCPLGEKTQMCSTLSSRVLQQGACSGYRGTKTKIHEKENCVSQPRLPGQNTIDEVA